MCRRDLWTALLAGAALAVLFSLSFVATPVKFLAPEVPLSHLLAVGRVTFRASLAVESVILIGLVALARGSRRWLVVGAAVTLAVQWLALMPRLDERTLARIAGAAVEPSSLHHWWIALDVLRIGIYAFVVRRACGAGGIKIAWKADVPSLPASDGSRRTQSRD